MSTPTIPSVEERLVALEREVQRLKCFLPRQREIPAGTHWFDAISGSMENYPEFEQVLEYGREFRKQQREP